MLEMMLKDWLLLGLCLLVFTLLIGEPLRHLKEEREYRAWQKKVS